MSAERLQLGPAPGGAALEQLPRRQDMRIRNLGDKHHEPFPVKTKFAAVARGVAQTGRSPSMVTRCMTRRWPW